MIIEFCFIKLQFVVKYQSKRISTFFLFGTSEANIKVIDYFPKKKFVCILSPEAQLSWQRPKFRPTPLRCYDLLFSNAIGPVLTLLASMSPVTTAMIRFTHLLGSLGLERLCGVTTALGWVQGACTALQWFLVHMRCRSSPLTLILYILSLLKIIF